MRNGVKIAIIGGGAAGATAALYLSEIGINVTLFEKGTSLVNGPPFCHLHAGGNLYREISDEQCVTLLKESIDLLRFFPKAIDYRPTVILLPKNDKGKPEDLLPRLNKLQHEYASLIHADKKNRVLGDSSNYFKFFDRQDIEALKQKEISKLPQNLDEWMIPIAKNVDFNKLQFPFLIVQEYGLNIFRFAGSVSLALEKMQNCQVLLNTEVVDINKNLDDKSWTVKYKHNNNNNQSSFDYLINAAGFRSGRIDDILGFKRRRLAEFKAAYVTQFNDFNTIWPEVIFHGERGTPRGMAQFTPYPGNHFQLHGMTEDITLFKDGLAKSSQHSSQPQLKQYLLDKVEKNWPWAEVVERSQSAIKHLATYIPAFSDAQVISKPLFGIQQVPGEDITLRTSNVSFQDRYARCEIVKVSSILSAIDAIIAQLIDLKLVSQSLHGKRNFLTVNMLKESDIQKYAESLCQNRGYPVHIASRSIGNT